MTDLREYIIASLLFHSGIELNERYGEFEENNCIAIAIANKIDNLYKKKIYKKDFTIYPKDVRCDVWFDEINVSYEIGNDWNLGYIYVDNIKTDIYIKVPKGYLIGELRKKIAHELQHYSEDMILIGKGMKSFGSIFNKDSEYGILYNGARNFNDKRIPMSARNLRRALYILDKFEQHAFIASLCEQIRQLKDNNISLIDPITPQEMWNIIKDTDEYKAFIDLANVIEGYKRGNLTKNDEEMIKKDWSNLTNKQENNIETIFNSILSKMRKAIKKLDNVLPKKIAETIETQYIQ